MNQDITFCDSKCLNLKCERNRKNINWDTPRHKNYGASMCDFSKTCYDKIIPIGIKYMARRIIKENQDEIDKISPEYLSWSQFARNEKEYHERQIAFWKPYLDKE